jgi:hypothetical protein
MPLDEKPKFKVHWANESREKIKASTKVIKKRRKQPADPFNLKKITLLLL